MTTTEPVLSITYEPPACFTPEFATVERHEELHGAWGDPNSDHAERWAGERIPEGWDDEPEPETTEAATPSEIAEALRCPDGDDNTCPTPTCGCPPF